MEPIGYLKLDEKKSAIVGDKHFMLQLWLIVKDEIIKHNEEVKKK